MKKILLSIFLVSLFLLRPYQLESDNLIYGNHASDDPSYLSHASAIVLGSFPSYEQEHFVDGKMPKYSMGPALLALPFVYVFSRVDVLTSSPVLQNRDERFMQSWAAFGFGFASVFYYCLSCLLTYLLLRKFYSERASTWATILLLVAQGIPLFAYRRPVFSHVYELFAQTLLLGLFLGARAAARPLRFGVASGLVGGLVTLTRYNNVFMALWLPVVTCYRGRLKARSAALLFAGFFAVFAALIFVFKIWPARFSPAESYQVSREIHFELLSFSYLTYRFFKLLFGWDWGLLWTAPFTLLGCFGFFFYPRNNRQLWLLSAPLSVNLVVTLLFASQGGWYGYRYLLFSLTPFAAFGFCAILEAIEGKRWKWALMAVLALPPVFSMLCFEGNPDGLTLRVIEQDGREDWGNDTYQLEVWKTVLLRPRELSQVVLKGIPSYSAVLLLSAAGKEDHLPAKLREKYPGGILTVTLIRLLILLAIPGLFLLFLWGWGARRSSWLTR